MKTLNIVFILVLLISFNYSTAQDESYIFRYLFASANDITKLSTDVISLEVDAVWEASDITGVVTTTGTLTEEKIAGGQVVKSINSLKDDVNLVAGSNVTITPNGNNLTISSTGSTGLTLPFEGTLNTSSSAALYLVHAATTGSNYEVFSSINSKFGSAIYGAAPVFGIEGKATITSALILLRFFKMKKEFLNE